MTDLSPAAQAVWDAFNEDEAGVFVDYGDKLAAALHAAADQVVPIRLIDEPDFSPGSCCERVIREERAAMRNDLLAIAAELGGGAQ